jgi:MFS family permease
MKTSPYFIPAMCLVAFGGPGAQNAIIHLSNLFPYMKATATAIITGSFQLSFIIFFIFDYLWQRSWDYRSIFLTYSIFCMFNIVLSALVWPDKAFNFDAQLKIEKGSQLDLTAIKQESELLKNKKGLIRYPSQIIRKGSPFISSSDFMSGQKQKDLKDMTLKEQIMSSTYIYVCMFFVVTSFWGNFFIGTIDLQLGDMQVFGSTELKMYGNIFTLVMSLGIFGIPVIGILMDKTGFPMTSFITLLFAVGWSFLLLLQTPKGLIGAFICYSVFSRYYGF